MKYSFLLLLIVSSLFSDEGQRVCYPIAVVSQLGEERIVVMDQQSLQTTQLWLYNPIKDSYSKGLMFMYNPTAVTVLPSGDGFSFIDRGRIRIKKFIARSVHSLDILEPLYHITNVQWVDDETCYFSAKQDGRFKLFLCDYDGSLQVLVDESKCNIVYPSRVGDWIFYLRSDNEQYITLHRVSITSNKIETLGSMGRNNMAFLTMVSPTEGYLCQMPFSLPTDEKNVVIKYNRIRFINNEIKTECLFSFEVPVAMIFGTGLKRLAESIVPLLPRHFGSEIYFSSNLDDHLSLYSYNKKSKKIALKKEMLKDCFSPIVFSDSLYFNNHPLEDAEKNLLTSSFN